MGPVEIARFLPILRNEAHEAAEGLGLQEPDMDRALAETVAILLADHVDGNQLYYERIRPIEADYAAEDLASR